MWHSLRVTLFLALAVGAPTSKALALTCGELPRVDDERLRAEIDVQGNILSKRIGSVEFGTSLDRSRTDIFSRYPNADRTRLNERLFIYLCQSLDADKSLTEAQKREELIQLRRQMDSPAPPPPPPRQSFFVGHWLIVDPRTDQPFSTIEMGSDGRFKATASDAILADQTGSGRIRFCSRTAS